MSFWDRLLVDLMPTVVMGVIAVSAVGTAVVVAYLFGVRHGRRDAFRAVAAMRAGFEEQIERTVPMLTRDGGR